MKDINNIVILTGAGVSAESGVRTFRDNGGLWEDHRIEDVATPEGFARDPALVHRFYDARRAALASVEPNAAHDALARLDREWKGELLLVTQNVDDLHERAGSDRLIHMHGELKSAWCRQCDARMRWDGPLGNHNPPKTDSPEPVDGRGEGEDTGFDKLSPIGNICPRCGAKGKLRPDIVWFGEMPYRMDDIYDALRDADLFVSIGTSGAVYPAAGFVREAREMGARTLELNMEPSEGSLWFHEARHGPASELVPAWVDKVLTGQ